MLKTVGKKFHLLSLLQITMRKIKFITDGIYHIFNRGVDGKTLFLDQADYHRFYLSLCVFNDHRFRSPGKSILTSLKGAALERYVKEQASRREPLVKIGSFILIPNHLHTGMKQVREDGISRFFHNVAMGFARYFNKRYERAGRLFQSVFKAVTIEHDSQLKHLPRYIHLNALDLGGFPWREGKVVDWKAAQRFLDSYPWSSHHVYMGRKQALPVVDEDFARSMFPSPEAYLKFLRSWSSGSISRAALLGITEYDSPDSP